MWWFAVNGGSTPRLGRCSPCLYVFFSNSTPPGESPRCPVLDVRSRAWLPRYGAAQRRGCTLASVAERRPMAASLLQFCTPEHQARSKVQLERVRIAECKTHAHAKAHTRTSTRTRKYTLSIGEFIYAYTLCIGVPGCVRASACPRNAHISKTSFVNFQPPLYTLFCIHHIITIIV